MIYVFDADLNALIQLYVVGVFTSFTLSQTGMVRHWLAEGRKGAAALPEVAQRSIVINAIGAVDDRRRAGGGHRHEVRQGRVALDPGDGR